MKVIVDLNILLDVLQRREPHYSNSRKCLNRLQAKQADLLISSHCIPTLSYILRKILGKDVACECVSWVLDTFDVALCSKEIFRKANDGPYPDFEDGIVIEEAIAEGCDWILTRDSKGFKNSHVRPISPTDFLTKG
ncbi:MAG: PIN domain-containing protein [Candidatus Omnitrophica bacterium]|nr:PIN domain-containing protein [Candidatus Omnitrophota bacterium]MCA9419115.1 PIN domain-containing protein [Candidatus Omnitrophota bacterium]MCA9427951.1 PIN domain-containing protein [Candidatus Omnitrophota bacterium]MCA9433916.1 PIN domain-containing protein [Candidatus Omnitrophota bacterium]MCA9441243.1 PIN domain-containing protein [Candidatus Omnitrophota bacterium]